MNPSTVPALTSTLVWSRSDMHDAMLVRTPWNFKLHIRAKIAKAWLVKNPEINQTFSLLVDMTEKLYQLWHSIGIDEDVHVWIEFWTEDLTDSTGCSDFLIFSTMLIPDI